MRVVSDDAYMRNQAKMVYPIMDSYILEHFLRYLVVNGQMGPNHPDSNWSNTGVMLRVCRNSELR